MNEVRDLGKMCDTTGGRGLGVAVVLSMLVSLAACAKNTAKSASNTANGIQNTANGITNTLNAVNGAADAAEKTFNVGVTAGNGVASLPPPQTNPHAGSGTACVIDDMADGNNQILLAGGRRGYWFSYVDKAGSTVSPPAGPGFTMSPSTASNMPPFAAHLLANMGSGGILYAGIGFLFSAPKAAYDASRYTGVSFWAKAEAASTKNVRFKISDLNTDPDGKVCTQCYNDFGSDLTFTDQWHQYVIPFSVLSQLSGWGAPHTAGIASSAIYGMQWQVNSPGTTYDISVSNISFTGCPYESARPRGPNSDNSFSSRFPAPALASPPAPPPAAPVPALVIGDDVEQDIRVDERFTACPASAP